MLCSMAKENEEPEDKPKRVSASPRRPQQQQRLQQNFEKGMQNVKKRNFDYAIADVRRLRRRISGRPEYVMALHRQSAKEV